MQDSNTNSVLLFFPFLAFPQTFSIKSASGAKQAPPRGGHGGGGGGGGTHGNHPNQVNANGGLAKSTPSSTDDMNSALLKSPSDSNDMGNGLYGKFKGFTLRPLNDATSPTNSFTGPNVAYVQPTLQDNSLQIPQRAAPPPPIKPTEVKMNGTLTRKAPPPPSNGVIAPALPPPNPGSNARPIISMPVLENSTMALPLKPMGSTTDLTPSRPAPLAPGETLKSAAAPPVPLHTDPKLNVKKDGTIRRITSFLKKEDKLPAKEKTYMDREKLKNLEISAPIPMQQAPQGESSNSDSELTPKEEETKNLVKRAQSMRSPTKKPNIQSFGSMRQTGPPGNARPRSAVSSQTLNGQRPKSPPPRPPPLKKTNSTTSSGYQLPISVPRGPEHMYDDCEFSEEPLSSVVEQDSPIHRVSDAGDNIYSVIDEIPPAAQTLKRIDLVGSQRSSVASSNDLGLLGEIVNEMEKRNGGESIYSAAASNFVKPKPKEESKTKAAEGFPSTTTSNAKETSNLASKPPTNPTSYLRPAPVNAPIARVAPTRSDLSPTTAFSSFKPSNNTSATAGATTTGARYNNNSTTAASSRPKSFIKTTQKPLPPTNTTTTSSSQNQSSIAKTASATIQKPKPLSAKPSFSNATKKSGLGSTTASTAKVTPRPPTAPTGKSSTNSTVASLTQRFEKPTNGIGNNNSTTLTTTTTSLRK